MPTQFQLESEKNVKDAQKVMASSVAPFIRCRPCTEWLALVWPTQDGFQKVVASSVAPFIRCRPCTVWLALISPTQDGFPRQILWSERETNDVV